ncbi:hypothetical protein SAMN04488107_1618 [Geodermatophilus saharensis]|uniref:Uncharacterized protein n=1 Tax=Geodermatophilus saharensis TaxID=1137994 RepID=A0A239C441_9ACTN|nr:hypothetical protein [Geodermatophilus saharensis]SNS15027.1 hypothetical protein SAMN04488107_1618 [Geodermatophilus saharensis]
MTEIDTRFDVGPESEGSVGEDEFDLDLRLGELAGRPGHPMQPFGGAPLFGAPLEDAQTDGAGCLPTGGKGEGGTCGTQNNTCPGTCAGRNTCPATACNTCAATCAGHNTCPATQCGQTCGNTCPRTDCNTCPRTDCGQTCGDFTNCGGTCANTHCFTCRSGCQEP